MNGTTGGIAGRLNTLQAALVIARRDFSAILFSRTFFFFLLGPLFPVIVALMAGSVTQKTNEVTHRPVIAVAMSPGDTAALLAAGRASETRLGTLLPELAPLRLADKTSFDARGAYDEAQGRYVAIASGTLGAPVLTGTADALDRYRGALSQLAAEARSAAAYPQVSTQTVTVAAPQDLSGRIKTGQRAQMLLFLLTMLLAGMVLSNLVEEKANKIIEVLAAAIPMDAVFFGKLFAMLGVSFVGIAVWGATFGTVVLASGPALGDFAAPAVGWPMFIALGIAYFATAYLVLGAAFLTIGSMATTVREVQTLSMPVSMSQLVTFFFASFAAARPGSTLALAAELFPFSSPFAMIAHAAQDSSLLPHLLALGWQLLWVAVIVRFGARLFRRQVMKSGPTPVRGQGKRRRWFNRAART